MREEADPQAVRGALDAIRLGHAGETASFKRSEKLRDDLMIATDAEMDALLAAFPAEDAAEIRGLTAKARNEREHSRPPHAYRACSVSSKAFRPNNDPRRRHPRRPGPPAHVRHDRRTPGLLLRRHRP